MRDTVNDPTHGLVFGNASSETYEVMTSGGKRVFLPPGKASVTTPGIKFSAFGELVEFVGK